MYEIPVKVKRLHPDAIIPRYMSAGAAGFDLHAISDVVIEPGETKKIPLGLAFEIPQGYEIQIRMRSGIAAKTKLRLPNGVGTVDQDFRGEVMMMFDNISREEYGSTPRLRNLKGKTEYYDGTFYPKYTYIIRKGDRVCQGVLKRVPQARFIEVDELGETERGEGGFGSTGTGDINENYATEQIGRMYE